MHPALKKLSFLRSHSGAGVVKETFMSTSEQGDKIWPGPLTGCYGWSKEQCWEAERLLELSPVAQPLALFQALI